ncbi:MAG: transposase [Kofleriaceae bacterium]
MQKEIFWHGGKRKGAGRKPRGHRAGTSHEERPEIELKHPLHITLRVVPEVGSLRRRDMYRAVREATIVAAIRARIRIVHLSIQATHIHMLVEADNKLALTLGMQGFQISVARNINTALGDKTRRRRGPVFADRYHVVVIRSPTQARNALSYVVNNWRKHQEDRSEPRRIWLVDPYSSGISFPDWRERQHEHCMLPIPRDHDPLIVFRPKSWLLREGWMRAGTVSACEVPSRPALNRC